MIFNMYIVLLQRYFDCWQRHSTDISRMCITWVCDVRSASHPNHQSSVGVFEVNIYALHDRVIHVI
jgi:hypothetical protein